LPYVELVSALSAADDDEQRTRAVAPRADGRHRLAVGGARVDVLGMGVPVSEIAHASVLPAKADDSAAASTGGKLVEAAGALS
jgi:hypothetical protein